MSVDGSFKDKHLWVKKTTGSGVTEFMLRLMAWLCTFKQTNHSGSIGNGQMCIVTGPNIDIATNSVLAASQRPIEQPDNQSCTTSPFNISRITLSAIMILMI